MDLFYQQRDEFYGTPAYSAALSREENEMIAKAAAWASAMHHGQVRKFRPVGRICPYVYHVQHVVHLIYLHVSHSYLRFAELLAAAYLHDTIEDTPLRRFPNMLGDAFGDYVRDLVIGMTNTSYGMPREPNETPASYRARRRLADWERLAGQSDDVKLLKLADRLANLQECFQVFEAVPAKWLQTYLEESRQIMTRVLRVDLCPTMYGLLEKTITDLTEKLQAGGQNE